MASTRKICLIRCPSPFLIDERVFPPLGLITVATALKLAGHEVTIHDGQDVPMNFDYYGFGPTTPEYGYALDTLKLIKANNPSAKVVIGGPYATLNPQRCQDEGFDCVVCGDGEIAAVQAFGNGSRLIMAEEKPLDDYPMIDRSVIDLGRYKSILGGRRATTMLSSQGCPFRCAFCSKNYKTVRMRSAERVIEEIKHIHHRWGYNAIAFPEDLFILNKERTLEICACLRELDIVWRCLIRADVLVKHGMEFTRTMADSGCIEVGMGVESGSDKILKIINKGETSETIKQAIRMLKDAGIRVKGFFIVGLPGEDYFTLDATRRFLEEMQLDDVDIKIFQPYPGTPIWENKERYDIDWQDVGDFTKLFYKGRPGEYYGTVATSALTTRALYDAWVDMEKTYKKWLT